MKSKTFILLLALCLVLAVAAYFVIHPDPTPENPERTGEALLSELPLGEVAQITVTGPKASVTLKKGETAWTVENRYGFPADFSKLTDLADKLQGMKIGRSFAADEDTLNRLALRPPTAENVPADQQATRIVLANASEKPLAEVLVGKPREAAAGSGGHYVKPADAETVYLVDKDFKILDTDPSAWLRKEILDVPPGDVARVRALTPQGEVLYTLKRPEEGASPEFVNPPEGKQVIPSKVNSAFGVLSGFRIEDVADPAVASDKTGLDQAPTLEYRLFDGAVYRLIPGNEAEGSENNFYFKAEATYQAPSEISAPAEKITGETPESESSTETDPPAAETAEEPAAEGNTSVTTDTSAEENPQEKANPIEPADDDALNSQAEPADASAEKTDGEDDSNLDPDQRRAEVEKLNQELSAWTYIVPGWKIDRFVTDPEAFFEQPEPPADTD
ncbi:MAG: DUF4340 domain-containing protein [Desulfococcaceae bacterium]